MQARLCSPAGIAKLVFVKKKIFLFLNVVLVYFISIKFFLVCCSKFLLCFQFLNLFLLCF